MLSTKRSKKWAYLRAVDVSSEEYSIQTDSFSPDHRASVEPTDLLHFPRASYFAAVKARSAPLSPSFLPRFFVLMKRGLRADFSYVHSLIPLQIEISTTL
ncbi:hypothetical protein TNCT_42161 [Trichonephila clavata]|uniref:Uncharacterized protein n=1 Tax=Trichonephila clavata TaxID=2740835 RepID=A0A8X6HAE3_TRICU|nr:hypothetical protein TNCT_42161 [Trichonephila clavata]